MNIVAHRGLRAEAPENTIASISAALKVPYIKGIEFDVEVTRDNQPVILHQETMVKSQGMMKLELAKRNFTSRDWVGELTKLEMCSIGAGSWFSEKFNAEKVPALSDVLSLNWGDTVPYVELKDATYWAEARDLGRPKRLVDAVTVDFEKFEGKLGVISFNPEVLKECSQRFPQFSYVLALWTEWDGKIDEAITVAKECGASGLTIPDLLALKSHEWVRSAHQNSFELHVYPVSPAYDEPEFKSWTAHSQRTKWEQLFELGIDSLVSDFGRESAEWLQKR